MMKAIVLGFCILVLSSKVHSQISVYGFKNIISNEELNDENLIYGASPLLGNYQNITFNNPSFDKQIIGCKEINLTPNTHLKPQQNSSLHLSINKPLLNVYCYSHTDENNIKALKKFETGVEIPDEISEKIEYFRTTEDSILGLNPFLEWNVSLKAIYTHLESGETDQNYGFYFKNYERNIPTNSWNEIPVNEAFRVRYAFKNMPGKWKVEYFLFIQNELYYSYCPFYIDVKQKDSNDDYVKVAANKRVLEKNGELFLPIGHNMSYPGHGDCAYNPTGEPCGSSAHKIYDEILANFDENGIDYVRVLLAPASFDVEYEKIGNYFDRLKYAWEIDKLIENVENRNMHVDLNLLLHFKFQINQPYALHQWDWDDREVGGFESQTTEKHYCYSKAFGEDIQPIDFFSRADCKKFYKQRLRYILSRISYSSHIALYELMSEINDAGSEYEVTYKDNIVHYDSAIYTKQYTPYESPENIHILYTWQKEMAEYIKHTLKDRHLIATSYAEKPSVLDPSFGIPEIDVMGYNSYPLGRVDFVDIIQPIISNFHDLYDKPVYFAETGELGVNSCDDGNYYQQLVWQYPFTGVAGFNFWDGSTINYLPQWPELVKMKNWILNDPMKTETLLGDWKAMNARSEITAPATLYHKEMNYIARRNYQGILFGQPLYVYDYAFGALHNMTDNYLSYNQEVNQGEECYDDVLDYHTPDWYLSSDLNQSQGNDSNWDLLITKKNLQTTIHPLMSPFPLNLSVTLPQLVTTRFRKINDLNNYEELNWQQNATNPFVHPLLCVTNDCIEKNRIYAFESILFPTQSWNILINNDVEEKDKLSLNVSFEGHENYETETNPSLEDVANFVASFHDMTGRKLKEIQTTGFSISQQVTNDLAKGMYIVVFKKKNQIIYQTCVTVH